MKSLTILFLIACLLAPRKNSGEALPGTRHVAHARSAAGMVVVPGGSYHYFLRRKDQPAAVKVHAFLLDVNAVTNGEFLAFVKANPVWARSRVSRLFADAGYLKQWAGDFEIGDDKIKNSPVTNVSWFAANAYAKWKGKRLPTLAEWEYAAAAAPEGMARGARLTRIILAWYDHPNPVILPEVRSTYENTYGLYDMHGLIWEWVQDFNSVIIQSDSSSGGTSASSFACAAGSLNSVNKEDYAAFMRFAFRQGLQARYTIQSLGFRCAKDY
ncbi:MAG: formylglycine-generating enzyme family protein [Bacteroidetes bacterium]|nr:formylglycine-generating enzyme family protein [Bacteroidota bacterium]